ncbi:hypothetical protein BDN72DRAFT_282201 [Pluteus cervinus]|uniref:Uncharacterized protein n=1 Tax=Pluteus cervinus TaxID=181527 RepID=A0ACD3B434_9AGAR|nr:hypothetical protein BDN72DRAFT_282201 [Pluteus cervinus]
MGPVRVIPRANENVIKAKRGRGRHGSGTHRHDQDFHFPSDPQPGADTPTPAEQSSPPMSQAPAESTPESTALPLDQNAETQVPNLLPMLSSLIAPLSSSSGPTQSSPWNTEPRTTFFPLPAPAVSSPAGHHSQVAVIVGSTIGSVGFIAIIIACIWYWGGRRVPRRFRRDRATIHGDQPRRSLDLTSNDDSKFAELNFKSRPNSDSESRFRLSADSKTALGLERRGEVREKIIDLQQEILQIRERATDMELADPGTEQLMAQLDCWMKIQNSDWAAGLTDIPPTGYDQHVGNAL